jgi:hypothetical protein
MPYQIIYVNEPAANRTPDESDLPENYRWIEGSEGPLLAETSRQGYATRRTISRWCDSIRLLLHWRSRRRNASTIAPSPLRYRVCDVLK